MARIPVPETRRYRCGPAELVREVVERVFFGRGFHRTQPIDGTPHRIDGSGRAAPDRPAPSPVSCVQMTLSPASPRAL